MPAIDARLGFHKLVKFNYFPGWHQQATVFELMINKDVWARDQRAAQGNHRKRLQGFDGRQLCRR